MNPTLQTLRDQLHENIDRFVEAYTFPLVERHRVTFVYRGPADAVQLRHWIYGLPSAQDLERLAGTDLWYGELELPEGSRIEYKFNVIQDGRENWINDPLNPLQASDPFGTNSVCQGYGYRTPDWTRPDPEAPEGRLEELEVNSRAFGGRRALKVYLPARFRKSRRYPLLIVHDGEDFLRYAGLKTVLDNLIHRLEIPPLIVALTQAQDRLKEYPGDSAHAAFLTEELTPLLSDRYPLLNDPLSRGLMGASFGAVASLYTAWRYPGFYGCLLLNSGSFAFTDIGRHRRDPVFDPVVRFVNAFRADPGRPAERIFMSCGVYESLIYENRSLVPLLQEQGMQVRYVEVRDGHNWENWRDQMQNGLSWLFPGPLWMVYE